MRTRSQSTRLEKIATQLPGNEEAPRTEVTSVLNARTDSGLSLDEIKVRSLDSFSSPIFILVNGKIAFANAACCDAFGAQSVDQIVGNMISERLADVQPDGLPLRASMEAFNAEYKLNGFVRRMWAFKRMDGSSLTIRSTVSSIPHPTVRCSVVVVDDLKAFAAELALRNQAVGASDRMSDTAQVLTGGARQLSEMSDRALSALRSALDSAEATAKNENVIAAAAQELATNTDSVMERVPGREVRAKEAANQANQARETISSLSAVTAQIGAVVELVSSIASQIRLLSLNATIEAERAGDAGRTFAVVAAEVRRLAVDTAKASADIKAQVQQVQAVTKSAVTAIDGISGSVDLLKEDTIELASDLRQQKDAIHEIATTLEGSTTGVDALRDALRDLASVFERNRGLSTNVLDQCTALKADAERLQDEVKRYSQR